MPAAAGVASVPLSSSDVTTTTASTPNATVGGVDALSCGGCRKVYRYPKSLADHVAKCTMAQSPSTSAGVLKRKREVGITPSNLNGPRKSVMTPGAASSTATATPAVAGCPTGSMGAESAAWSTDRSSSRRKRRRKKEHEILYGPSSHRCNCARYESNFVHLPLAAGNTTIAMKTAVWVIDFDEACRLRVLEAVVCSNETKRSNYYEGPRSEAAF